MDLASSLAIAIEPDGQIEQGDGQAAIEADEHRLNALLAGDESARGYRLWTNTRSLVTSRRFAALPNYSAAAAASAARGWPVFVRASGGTTVAHRPGMLIVSRYERLASHGDVGGQFAQFCEGIAGSLRAIGIAAEVGPVPFSHCDGRFNICLAGRKVGGTASMVRSRGGRIALLCHATIWLDGRVAPDLDAIEAFERDLDRRIAYDRSAHASLRELLTHRSIGGLHRRTGAAWCRRSLVQA